MFASKNDEDTNILGDEEIKNGTIKVGTLNYSGILTSPYQYYDHQDENEKKYSQVFTQIVGERYPAIKDPNPKNFKWDMGNLDPKWKNRYSPINILECGVKNNEEMMDEEEFLKKWDQVHDKTKDHVVQNYFKKKYSEGPQQIQRQQIQIGRCREFDLFCYKTILKVLSQSCKPEQNLINNKISPKVYLSEREKQFSKSFLDEKAKIQKTLDGILKGKYDIFCFQEVNEMLIARFKEQLSSDYHIFFRPNILSCIIAKKSAFLSQQFNFEEENNKFLQECGKLWNLDTKGIEKKLILNKDSLFQVFPQNIVVFSIHLTSKAERNAQQMNQMKEIIKIFLQKMPHLRIIFNGDLNASFSICQNEYKKDLLSYFPDSKQHFTANKKRTMMQPQRHKAEKLDQMSKDYIITNLPIINCQVQLINGEVIKKGTNQKLLPTHQHPYDHYLVSAEISL